MKCLLIDNQNQIVIFYALLLIYLLDCFYHCLLSANLADLDLWQECLETCFIVIY